MEGGCTPGDRVCIVMPKSPMAIVAMHAIMKAGCTVRAHRYEQSGIACRTIVSASEPRWLLATEPASGLIDDIMPEDSRRLASRRLA